LRSLLAKRFASSFADNLRQAVPEAIDVLSETMEVA
jgi:hypothetical protein